MPANVHHNSEPQGFLPEGAPRDAVKKEFAKRLQQAMTEKGWTQSELARQAALHTPDQKFNRDNVSLYVRGVSLPGPVFLNALSKALGRKPQDLLPSASVPSVDTRIPPMEVKDVGDGQAWVRVNQALPWAKAVQIMQIVNDIDK